MTYRDDETSEATIMFERSQAVKRAETERRKAAAGDNVARIRLDVSKKVKSGKLDGAIVNHNGKKLVNKEEAFR